MTTHQPAAPAAPAAPTASTGAGESGDLARQIDNVNKAVEQVTRNADARAAVAARQAATAAQTGGVGVIKDPGGRIVVTGPDGKTITIDPKAGLDGDQIQELVQTALQPTRPERPRDNGPSGTAVAMVAIVFTFLFLMVVMITRASRARHAAVGSSSTAVLPPETVARLARIEQAVEAVAIEVERISEAQRYSAQLLTDRLPSGGAAGSMAPTLAAARGE